MARGSQGARRAAKVAGRGLVAALLAAGMLACAGGAAVTPPPTPTPSPTVDPSLAGAVADALATIDEIDRLYQKGPTDAVIGLMSDVAGKGRTSLAREPARVTTSEPFQVYDLTLQKIQLDITTQDGAALVHDHDWLVYTVRKELAALVP